MEVPDKFDDQTVAFSVINDGDALHSSPWDIIRHNMVWVASGLIVGTPQVNTRDNKFGIQCGSNWLQIGTIWEF